MSMQLADRAPSPDQLPTSDASDRARASLMPHEDFPASALGDAGFRSDYGLKYAYLTGAMYKGIASKELVAAMGKAGLMGYFGAGGVDLDEIEATVRYLREELKDGQSFGMNLLSNLAQPEIEKQTVELYLKHRVRYVEAAAYMQISPSLVKYRLSGLKRSPNGLIEAPNRVLAKVSRPEVAKVFMQPAPEAIVRQLVAAGDLTSAEAELGRLVPIAGEICVEADSGGHTDQGVAYALTPAMISLRQEIMTQYRYTMPIRIGAAGGIGTPQAAAAAFMMGADFVLTGSINQCTVEAGTSDAAKDMLQDINVQDTAYAPAGDMFEMGAKVQVLRKGVLFPARANKLYELYMRHEALEQIDEKTRAQIQEKYFKRSFDDVWQETRAYLRNQPKKLEEVERNPKQKMAALFRWYFVHSTRLAMKGSAEQKVDYQIQCGPALGAFNQWVKGTELESWRNRRVADLAERIMQATARLVSERFRTLCNAAAK